MISNSALVSPEGEQPDWVVDATGQVRENENAAAQAVTQLAMRDTPRG